MNLLTRPQRFYREFQSEEVKRGSKGESEHQKNYVVSLLRDGSFMKSTSVCGSIWKELQLCFCPAPEGKSFRAPGKGSQGSLELKV